MNRSDQINELAAALAKAQGEIKGAETNADNPHYKSRYADLSSVWEAARAPLSKNGLSIVQAPFITEVGWELETVLLHSSGQWAASYLPLIQSKPDMQGLGAAITYAKRFALAAMVGIAEEDDDGETAVGRTPAKLQPARTAAAAPVRPVAAPKPGVVPSGASPNAHPSEAQLKRLFAIATASHWTHDQVKNYIQDAYEVASTKELTLAQYDLFTGAIMPGGSFETAMAKYVPPFEPGADFGEEHA